MTTPPPDDNPAPPSPAAADPDAPGSPLRAVLTGLAIDIGGTSVLSAIASTLYVLQVQTSGMSEDQVNATLAQGRMPSQSGFAVLAMLGGAACSVVAGYACARIVQRDELRVGGLMAILLAVLLLLVGADSDDMLTLLTASSVACNLLGVKYGIAANQRRRALKALAEAGEAPPQS